MQEQALSMRTFLDKLTTGIEASNNAGARLIAIERYEQELKATLLAAERTGDLYAENPEFILDDIVGSYQFDVDDEKFVDCY